MAVCRFSIAVLGVSFAMSSMAQPALVPIPQSLKTCPGEFEFERLKLDEVPTHEPVHALTTLDGIPFGESSKKLTVRVGSSADDESYTLAIGADGIAIKAPSRTGALHAFATLAQLKSGKKYPCVQIDDRPRFPWRGLLLDVSRHFMPIQDLYRTLDRMAAVKLNVLHLHLADDQGVRVESKLFPLLQQKASGGQYYTQEQLGDLHQKARLLGIRIVPEFDFPGHATAWFAAYPELASAPGPYSIERKIGIFDPAFDPSNPKTYEFIEGFLTEMAALFPDLYIHLGGDEVNGKHWDSSPRIQAFKKAQGLASNHDLQVYFEDRMHAITKKLGKKLVLWDEVIHPKTASDITYQAWRGPNALLASAFLKHQTLVSYGFYLDWGLSTEQLYHNQLNGVLPDETDPILKRLNPLIKIPSNRPPGMLTEAEAANRLGGEAALWSEFTTPANLDTRLWPRLAVVAERLWSPAEKSQDLDDLYRRLNAVFPQPQSKPLEDLLEPGKYVYRHLSRKYTVNSPMDQLVDRLPMESYRAQEFNRAALKRQYKQARMMLERWNEGNAEFDSTLAAEARKAIQIGREALDSLEGKSKAAPTWAPASLATLKALSDNHREIVIAICPGVISLIRASEPRP